MNALLAKELDAVVEKIKAAASPSAKATESTSHTDPAPADTTGRQSTPEEIARLRQQLQRLVTVWDSVFSRRMPHDAGNYMAAMALAFAARQGEHARAVLRLQPSADAVLITRSMFEGLCQLLWAAHEPEDRPLRWRAFAYVQDWRTLQRKLKDSEAVTPEERTRIENAVQLHEHLFLTARARKARASGASLPDDPYVPHWHGTTIKDIFTAVKGELAHRELYRRSSDYHHWGIAGFAPLLRVDDDGNVHQKGSDPALTATALASAFQCLWQTLKALDEIGSLGIGADLQRLYDAYVGEAAIDVMKPIVSADLPPGTR